MQWVSKMKVCVVEQVSDGALLLLGIIVRKLWQKLSKMLPLRICQYIIPGPFTQHREEYVRLWKRGKRTLHVSKNKQQKIPPNVF